MTRLGVAAVAIAALGIAAVAAVLVVRDGDAPPAFAERAVRVADLPALARDEVNAHGGGRCVEQLPSVFRCRLARAKQAHEGPGGRVWCFDSDGPQVLSSYPARRRGGTWACAD